MEELIITLEEAITCMRYVDLLCKEIQSEDPSKVALLAARFLITEYNRDLLPDWVALVAGGNLETWDQVIDEARIEIAVDKAINEEKIYGDLA
ncbi:hypothetical protein C4588_04270 [Candidatus Parcubacteria bacterium]|nr:MAG: hypothetical protein C4588_04270 [Candidatus Parcubacteria bacterium]